MGKTTVKLYNPASQYSAVEYDGVEDVKFSGPNNEFISFKHTFHYQSDGETVTKYVKTNLRYLVIEEVKHSGTISV